MVVKKKTTSVREKRKMPIATERESPPGKYKGLIELAKKRGVGTLGIGDLFLREDCPCPSIDCPHRGNCMACICYHHMMFVIGAGGKEKPRMILTSCNFFSERDYWIQKRKTTSSPEVKEVIDEWLAYYQNTFNLRRDMCRNRELMEEFDKVFEDHVNEAWMKAYANKNAKQRAERIAKNKKAEKGIAGSYPYK